VWDKGRWVHLKGANSMTMCGLGYDLVHKDDVVSVEGEIMHELKMSALSARDRYYIARVH